MSSDERTIGELVAEIRALRRDIDAMRTTISVMSEELDDLRGRIRISTAWAIGLLVGIGAVILGARETLRRIWEALS